MLTRTPTLTSHLHPNSHRTRRVRGVPGRCRYIQVVHGVPGQHGRRAYRADQFVAANPTMHAEYHHVWAKCAAALKQVRSDFPIRAMRSCTALRLVPVVLCPVKVFILPLSTVALPVVDVDIVVRPHEGRTVSGTRRTASGLGHRGRRSSCVGSGTSRMGMCTRACGKRPPSRTLAFRRDVLGACIAMFRAARGTFCVKRVWLLNSV